MKKIRTVCRSYKPMIGHLLGDARRRLLDGGSEMPASDFMSLYSLIYDGCIHDRSPGKEGVEALHGLFGHEMSAFCTGLVHSTFSLSKKMEIYEAGLRFFLFSFRYLDRFHTRRSKRSLAEQAREICGSVLLPSLLAETRALLGSRQDDTVLRMIAWSVRNGFSTRVLATDLVGLFGERLSASPRFPDADSVLAHRDSLRAEIERDRLVAVLGVHQALKDMIDEACRRDERPLLAGMRSFLERKDLDKIRVLFRFARPVLVPAFRRCVSEAMSQIGRLRGLWEILESVHEDYGTAFRETIQDHPALLARSVGWFREDAENVFLLSFFPDRTAWFACYEKILCRALMDGASIERERGRLRWLETEADRNALDRLRLLLHDFTESRRWSEENGDTHRLVILRNGAPSDPLRSEPMKPWDAWLMPEMISFFRTTDAAYRDKTGKRLVFSLWNSTAEVMINGRMVLLAAVQLAFLYLVVYRKRDTQEQIAEATGMDPGIVGGVLHSLSRGRILRRSGDTFAYEPSHETAFPLPAVMKRMPARPPEEDTHRLRAAIVSVMKREREMTERELEQRVGPLGREVAVLVDQEYLERKGDRLCYVP